MRGIDRKDGANVAMVVGMTAGRTDPTDGPAPKGL
jgi:hypothetical protein